MSGRDEVIELLETEEPDFELVMACVFGVQGREVRTYLALLERPGSTVEELAGALERDRSNVNRSLSRLLDLELVERERRLLDEGGYVYQYTATPIESTKSRLHDALDAWVGAVHDHIDEFGPGGSAAEGTGANADSDADPNTGP